MRHFRNYTEKKITFGPKTNVIIGDNAKGKTNLLEAISLVSTGRSFRTQHLSELIQNGASFFCVEAEIIKDTISHDVRLYFDGKSKKLHFHTNIFPSFAPLLGAFPSVVYLPEDVSLITDTPGVRRKFLNLHLAQSDPLYVHHLSRFWRSMKQRNCLLKSKKEEDLDCWESEMAASAHYLLQARTLFLEKLHPSFQSYSDLLSLQKEAMTIRFQPTYPSSAASYRELLKKTRRQELELGFTAKGPHRDDLSFCINEQKAEMFASQGQKKTMSLSLRFAQWKHLREQNDCPALMAIDDMGSMLDASRQEQVYFQLKEMQQTFITTPSPLPYVQDAYFIPIS